MDPVKGTVVGELRAAILDLDDTVSGLRTEVAYDIWRGLFHRWATVRQHIAVDAVDIIDEKVLMPSTLLLRLIWEATVPEGGVPDQDVINDARCYLSQAPLAYAQLRDHDDGHHG